MNKDEAMRRLETIEKETAELKKIIETPEEIVYDFTKLYVVTLHGGYDNYKHVLLGINNHYSWYTLESTENTLSGHAFTSGKEALDYVRNRDDITMHVFCTKYEVLTYLMGSN